ncbi:MAG: glycosyltransferase family 1 protein [Saprospiraceae bacterium]|nr:glycosyltransferase family 1 protein [Saprospiraceae bacterium]
MTKEVRQFDIILNTLFRTDNSYSSVSLSFAKEMAKTNRVFYVNHPYSYKDIYDERKKPLLKEKMPTILMGGIHYETLNEIPENFIAATPPATLPINFLPNNLIYNGLYQYNRKRVLNTVKRVIKDHNVKDFIYLTCYDPFFAPVLPKDFGAFLSIYQCIDDISTEAYVAKHGVRLEKEAAKASDLTLVTSTNLRKIFLPIQPETYIMHNAVDISIFQNLYFRTDIERPAEIAHIKTPIIGFVGNLDPIRTDYPLFRKIADAHPDKTLVLVGPINSPEVYEQGLDKMPNVVLTGAKKIQDVPQYLKFMDVCLLPSLLNKMTKSVYPLKINEYLAAGKSAISTNFSDDIRSFGEHIHIAQDHADFVRLIDIAIKDYAPERVAARMKVASTNTWGDRVREFWSIIEEHTNKKSVNQADRKTFLV